MSEISNKNTAGRIRPTACSAQHRAKSPALVYNPSFCLRDSAAPSEPALHLRHPVRGGDSRDFPPLHVPWRFKKLHRKYSVSEDYYARLNNICQHKAWSAQGMRPLCSHIRTKTERFWCSIKKQTDKWKQPFVIGGAGRGGCLYLQFNDKPKRGRYIRR